LISGKEEKKGRGENEKRRKEEKETGLKIISFGELKITDYFCTPQTEAILINKE